MIFYFNPNLFYFIFLKLQKCIAGSNVENAISEYRSKCKDMRTSMQQEYKKMLQEAVQQAVSQTIDVTIFLRSHIVGCFLLMLFLFSVMEHPKLPQRI